MRKTIKGTLKFCLFVLLPLLIFRSFLYEPFIIPSGSMKDTLLVGDYILVSKYTYGYSRFSVLFSLPIIPSNPRAFYTMPKRGDVVVFRGTHNNSTNYIKRIIGLPGDRIQVLDGILYINDNIIARKPDGQFTEHQSKTQIKTINRYIEVVEDDRCYDILQETTEGAPNNTGIYVVPDNHFFVMGDNRDNSTDSRFFGAIGFVPAENLVGRAERVLISFGRSYDSIFPFKVRFERIWKNINPAKCKDKTQ